MKPGTVMIHDSGDIVVLWIKKRTTKCLCSNGYGHVWSVGEEFHFSGSESLTKGYWIEAGWTLFEDG